MFKDCGFSLRLFFRRCCLPIKPGHLCVPVVGSEEPATHLTSSNRTSSQSRMSELERVGMHPSGLIQRKISARQPSVFPSLNNKRSSLAMKIRYSSAFSWERRPEFSKWGFELLCRKGNKTREFLYPAPEYPTKLLYLETDHETGDGQLLYLNADYYVSAVTRGEFMVFNMESCIIPTDLYSKIELELQEIVEQDNGLRLKPKEEKVIWEFYYFRVGKGHFEEIDEEALLNRMHTYRMRRHPHKVYYYMTEDDE